MSIVLREQSDMTSASVTVDLLKHVEKFESSGVNATLGDRVERGMLVLEQSEAWLRGVAVNPISPSVT